MADTKPPQRPTKPQQSRDPTHDTSNKLAALQRSLTKSQEKLAATLPLTFATVGMAAEQKKLDSGREAAGDYGSGGGPDKAVWNLLSRVLQQITSKLAAPGGGQLPARAGVLGHLEEIVRGVGAGRAADKLSAFREAWHDPQTLIDRGRQEIKSGNRLRGSLDVAAGRTISGLKDAGGFMADAAGKPTRGEDTGAVGGMVKAASSLAGMVPVAGRVVGGLGMLAGTVLDGVEKIKQWNRGLFEANTRFAEVSAGMARVQAMQEVRDIQLNREKGAARAGTAGFQAEGMSRLERASAPLENLGTNVMNILSGTISNALAGILESTRPVVDKLNKILERLGFVDKEQTQFGLSHWMDEEGIRHAQSVYGRPGRFDNILP